MIGRLGGAVVSVLATGPKVRGFEPGQDDGFLRAIKNPKNIFLSDGRQSRNSHVVRYYGVLKNS
jgi:hypothetical protein